MAGEYIFSISELSKTYGPKKIFENINLSFYHGAKIGFVGENGTGKSTLLRIMAGRGQGTRRPRRTAQRHPHRVDAAGTQTRR